MDYSKENPAGTGQSNVVYLGGFNTYKNRLKPPKRQAPGDKEYEYLHSLLCTLKDGVAAQYLWDLVKHDYMEGFIND